MIIVRAQGGLGNQMFQYALYKVFLSKGISCRMSLYYYMDYLNNGKLISHAKKYLINDIFETETIISTKKEDEKLGSVRMGVLDRLLRKHNIFKKTHIREDSYPKYAFDASLFRRTDAYLDGYWQTYKYAELVRDELKHDFTFKNNLSGRNLEVSNQMKQTNSVSIHVRRGDYQFTGDYALLGEEYYHRAIQYILENVENPVFYCFSDDLNWCKEIFLGDKIIYVDWNTSSDSFIDMQLMSLCKHHIVANSSFSYWGAWLGENDKTITIRPAHYYKTKQETYDRWPPNWIEV